MNENKMDLSTLTIYRLQIFNERFTGVILFVFNRVIYLFLQNDKNYVFFLWVVLITFFKRHYSKLNVFADGKSVANIAICCLTDTKHCAKSRKCWLPAFSSLSHFFPPKGLFLSRDFMVKVQIRD